MLVFEWAHEDDIVLDRDLAHFDSTSCVLL
jgi:hypothetical protein